jgi:hypothetical protein
MALPGLVAANNLSDVVDRERAWDNLGSSVLTNIPIPSPSLDLNFAANKSLVDNISGNNLITFSRASTGTFIGSNGLLQTAASGVPRFDHNPVTGESLGLLVEEARTNLLRQSSDLTTASWTLTSVTRTANSTTAPDGTNTAVKIASTTGTFLSALEQSSVSVTAVPTTFSCYAKAAEASWFCLVGIQAGEAIAYFNLATGALGTRSAGTAHSITPVGNGWYRCSVTCASASSTRWGFFPGSADNTLTPAPIGNGVHVWAPQLEAGAFPTSYIPTVASTVTRAADVASITGANFSSWYNGSNVFSTYCEYISVNRPIGTVYHIGDTIDQNRALQLYDSTNFSLFEFNTSPNVSFSTIKGLTVKTAFARQNGNNAGAASGVIVGSSAGSVSVVPTQLSIGGNTFFSTRYLNSTIKRFAYYPVRLHESALQYITSASGSLSSTTYPYTFTVKGKDTLALNECKNASVRDFVFIKGLSSSAQPRLTTAAQQVASGTAFQNAAMLKASPTTSGNYLFSSGVTLSGVSTRINNTQALSIATSPFSGSTATASILLRELQPQANWRITEPMPSGTIASPEFAIPFETNDFLLFMKAGQN